MEVTQHNLRDAAALFEGLVGTADFVAMDAEMTGIMLDSTTAPNFGDSCGERYAKMRRVANEFTLMQVGLCLFHKEGEKRWRVRPFNFYVCPGGRSSARLVMYANTAQFHREHGMDFNRWLRDGVPYMQREEYEAHAHKLVSSPSGEEASQADPAPARSPVHATKPEDVAFVRAALASLEVWLARGPPAQAEDAATGAPPPDDSASHADVVPAPLELPECNSFLRRVLLDELRTRPELQFETVPGSASNRTKIAVYRLTEEQREARRRARREAKLKELDERAGFLRVFKALAASGKPVVGHNCLYDLLFLFRHFEADLPATLAEFKFALARVLPRVWDTKLLAASAGTFAETTLAPLFAACTANDERSRVRVVHAEGFARYEGGGQCHEAGYDALMTGVVFASLHARGLAPEGHANHCYLMRSMYTLNLAAGPDPVVETGEVLHLCGFDASLKTYNLQELIAVALPRLPRVQIRWVDDTSALAVLPPGSCDPVQLSSTLMSIAEERIGGTLVARPFAEWRAARDAAALATDSADAESDSAVFNAFSSGSSANELRAAKVQGQVGGRRKRARDSDAPTSAADSAENSQEVETRESKASKSFFGVFSLARYLPWRQG